MAKYFLTAEFDGYPFSQWTPEWELLKKAGAGEQRNSILDRFWVLDDAIRDNSRFIDILENDHPRTEALRNWLLRGDKKNLEWYRKNEKDLCLVNYGEQYGIQMLWDVFCLEDEKVDELTDWVTFYDWIYYFDYDVAIKHAESQWKRLPEEWSKYTNFLPWDWENVAEFLFWVLWLKTAWIRKTEKSWRFSYYSSNANYWSSVRRWKKFADHLTVSKSWNLAHSCFIEKDKGLPIRLILN